MTKGKADRLGFPAFRKDEEKMKLSRLLIATVLMGTFVLSSPMTALNAELM